MKGIGKIFYGCIIAFGIWMLVSWIEVIAICQIQHTEPSELNFYSVYAEYCGWVENG